MNFPVRSSPSSGSPPRTVPRDVAAGSLITGSAAWTPIPANRDAAVNRENCCFFIAQYTPRHSRSVFYNLGLREGCARVGTLLSTAIRKILLLCVRTQFPGSCQAVWQTRQGLGVRR